MYSLGIMLRRKHRGTNPTFSTLPPLTSMHCNLHRVSGKNSQNCFCHNFVKFQLTLMIIFGINMARTIKLCKTYLFSISTNFCQWQKVNGIKLKQLITYSLGIMLRRKHRGSKPNVFDASSSDQHALRSTPCLREKNSQNCFCHNFVKFQLTLSCCLK